MSIQNFSIRLNWPRLVCSLPVLLVTLYFVPALGVILTIARLFIYGSYRYYRVPAALLVVALFCLIPRAYELAQQNFQIPVFQPLIDFRSHAFYEKLTAFGRFTAIFSIIMLVLSQILGKLATSVSGALRMAQMAKSVDTSNRKPGLTPDKPTPSQTDQTTPHVLKCPHCGKVNHIKGTVGDCKSCRNPIEWTPPRPKKRS
ncbi:hypothetical protein IKQ65_01090 [Candidatus Saccharibacteria bacterium]|nr:hypothetical protein [Candidatus Saccharibacteria bacterium]MBR6961332.1 hypothetical protein [Candidatus Saccharibacteria bacterium]